jgi:hypothetical protein
MTPPYFSDVRCVVWAAGGRTEAEASASGALAFAMLLDDGVELTVEPAGASAILGVRSAIEYRCVVPTDGRSEIRPLGSSGQIDPRRSRVTQWSRIVAWLAAGDEVTVEGRLVRGAPFRGQQCLVATRITVAGGDLAAASLAPGEAEPR